MFIVYKFVDKEDKVLYVGQSRNFESRLNTHLSKKNNPTINIIDRIDNIYIKICSNKFQMDNTERFYINKYKPEANTIEKYDDGIFPLYEDNPWILYTDKFSIFDIIDKRKNCFEKLGFTFQDDFIFKNNNYFLRENFDYKHLLYIEEKANEYYSAKESESFIIFFLKEVFEKSLKGESFDDFNLDFIKDFNEDYSLQEIVNDDIVKDEEINDILEELKTNKNILTPSLSIDEEEKEKNKEKHNKLKKSWKHKYYYRLVDIFGMNEEEAIDLLKNSKQAAQVGKVEKKIVLDYIKTDITKEDIVFLKKYLKNKENELKSSDLKNLNLFTYRLKKTESLFKDFKTCIDKGFDLEKMIKHIQQGKSISSFLDYEAYIESNKNYKSKIKPFGLEERIQYFIINNIGKYNNKDNSYLTDDKIKDITNKINKEFKEKKYNEKDIKKRINKIFKISKDGRLNGLRLK